MVKILPVLLILFSSFIFGQNAAQLESQRVAEANYKVQVSNGAFEKATDEMRRSAETGSAGKFKKLNDDFEFNFAEKQKFESKLNSLLQKKSDIEVKINQTKSKTQKTSLQEKLATLNFDLEKLNKKLEQNEIDLKILQEIYRNLNK